MLRRWVLGVTAIAWTALLAPSAGAHAVLAVSEPAAGATLDQAPDAVTIVFTEDPEPALSFVRVLDTSGRSFDEGRAIMVVGQPAALRVDVKPLPKGVYTVTWRTVSRVDGHVTSGAFAFGVGESPSDVRLPDAPEVPGATWPGVLGRWGLYVGLIGLVGGASVGAIAFANPPARVVRLLVVAWPVAVAGLAALAVAQHSDAGAPWDTFLDTAVGRSILFRAAALGIAGVGAVAALVSTRRRGLALIVVIAGALAAIVSHVLAGHADTGGWRWAKVAMQSVHFTSVGLWIGGLAGLLAGVRGESDPAKVHAARRFSTMAAAGLVLVAVTGAARAADEVGAWNRLTTTSYGRLVLVKVVLLAVLAVLGAINRYRNLVRTGESLAALRKVGLTELAVAAIVLGVAGGLASTAPAKVAAGTAATRPLSVEASDFGTAVRVRLDVSPGRAGVNRFVARVTDYDTREPVDAEGVTIRFSFPADPDVGSSTLDLKGTGRGTYEATGPSLSLDGTWQLTVLIVRGVDSLEVPMKIKTRSTPQKVNVLRTEGQPTIYAADLGAGRQAQIYVDPERPGTGQLHVTFFVEGKELPVGDDTSIVATLPSGTAHALEPKRFSPGHFVAEAELSSGRWIFDVVAPMESGERLRARVTITIR